ncbi:hypothetical protein KFK09_000636 [Dendrobium nobile]|uniref:DUF4283 domain-containing protein n=1 Tax=Dendrobium nobile TaxID=94219 RepID=A0A8T3C938_DENNO|nr:hypothetical protein KFK09_000636 [Dendrobium nobile]
MAASPLDFPPLPSSSVLGPSPGGLSYAANVLASSFKPTPFPASFYSPGQKLSFKADDLSEGKTIWTSALIGYSLGPRPFYERLLKAMQKLWQLKGSMTLLSLEDGFFLLKFSTEEDLEMVLSGGPWFLLGKPFILQRWSPKFKSKRDEAAPIPIWIKIVDFPLALWTPTGISKISSYVGIPISVDSLTANRTRLAFARVCVLISKDSVLPDEISIEIEGEDLVLKVLYDWKPEKCEGCGSLIHHFSLCPKNPNPQLVLPPQPPKNRGRSTSRPHSNRPHRSPSNLPPPKPPITPVNPIPTTIPTAPPVLIPSQSAITQTRNDPPLVQPQVNHSTIALAQNVSDPAPSHSKSALLPNLNSPTEETSSSGKPTSPNLLHPPKIPLLNKFASLQTDEQNHFDSSESFSETKISSSSVAVDDPPPYSRPQILSEPNCHNTRSSVDKEKSPNKSKLYKGKSAKKAKGQNS